MNSPVNLVGNLCIALCVVSSLVGIVSGWTGCRLQKQDWIILSRRCVFFNFLGMTLANLSMVYALLANDFSVSYVAHVGAIETPRFFAAISLWSSLEGSILFWGFILSAYSALCMYVYRNQFSNVMPWVGVTLLFIGLFFFIVLALPANPFVPVMPPPMNGPGPNPLLQNHWLMGVHPPVLYLGYVGMSVPFSFAVASLLSGELTDAWVQVTRRWILTAWMFLSTAIILGGWWSYAVLGWGGYWAWDPVENASLMPWLTATAFLHSVMVQNQRQMLKVWNLTLIVTTFLLTILGTFLTRSGVLESVHSFTQSGIGHYFLAFIAIILILSTALLIWKGDPFRSEGRLNHPLSRETFFLLNNLLLVCLCFVVLLGTMYPLVVEALRNRKVSVGEPFFNQMTVPLAVAIILLIGLGSATPWRKADPKVLVRKFLWPFVLALLGVIFLAVEGIHKTGVCVTAGCAIFSLSIMILEMTAVTFHLRSPGKLFLSNPRRYGGFVVHIGIIVIALGIAFSKNYQEERQVTLKEGESFQMGNREFRFEQLLALQKPNRFEVIAEMKVSPPGILLEPRLNFYPQNREPIGSPSVHSTPVRDLYLTLMAFDKDRHEVSIRAIVTPVVSWIWMGGGIIILGTLIAAGLRKNGDGYP